MNKTRSGNVASVHQRILNISKESGRPFNELLQYYAMEKFLLRVCKSSYARDFVLKGALLLKITSMRKDRPTRDIDLLMRTEMELVAVEKIFSEICIVKVMDDALEFDPGSMRTKVINVDKAHDGIRISFEGSLGAARLPMQVDIGFGDDVFPKPSLITYPTILEGEAPRLLAYSLESVVAEKYHAMIFLGMANSRMKDFYDIYYLCNRHSFDAEILAESIKQTFKNRNTGIPDRIPVAFLGEFSGSERKKIQWRAFIRKTGDVDIPQDFASVIKFIKGFLWPLTKRMIAGKALNIVWKPNTGWV